MKLSISILLIVQLAIQVKGQDFKLSNDFILIEPEYELDSLFWATPYTERKPIKAHLTRVADTNTFLQEFSLLELETYDGNRIYTLEQSNLKNVKQIVQVQFDYFACCVSVDNHYFLITEDGNWIKLPSINYVACDGPEPFEEYRFPGQKFGMENSILKTTSHPDSTFTVDSIEVIERFTWNGKEIIKN
jgi:hypothetical protein